MGRTAVALGCAFIVVWGTVASSAQSKPRLIFEVASVRVFPVDGQLRNLNRMTEKRVDLIQTMGAILMQAFRQQRSYRISAPEWLSEVYVEIQATMPAGATVQQVPEMLQVLLEERFGMVTHREARPMDAYELVVAPGGIKMREVEPVNEVNKEVHLDPRSGEPQRGATLRETPDGIVRTFQVPGGGFTRLTSRTLYERRTVAGGGGSIITATRMSMAELVPELETNVDTAVVDRTGLTGLYQFMLRLPYDALFMRMDALASARLGQRVGAARETVEPVSRSKELEGLGLRLERRRVPVEMIIVDKLSRTPTEN